MDKRFDPSSYERRWQDFWRARDVFRAGVKSDEAAARPFCIMIPPPNVTGKLHMGHALQSALQDLIVRWRRMQGYDALWLPGTDHAGIATQLMVERQLEAEGTSRVEVGRERFLERVWDWKEEYHSNIQRQLEVLGSSCDWSRERFTMDDGLSLAVRTAFVRLHREGLISRGEYMVNWSPVLGTAISDLEVESREVRGKLYHIVYPLADGHGQLVVATTRPETLLGDMAVAANPNDSRYTALIGRQAQLPLTERRIPIVADEHVDPEFGSGLVKVTPFHDPNDWEIARRHGLEGLRVIDFSGRMTAEAGSAYAGMDRFEARAKVIADLEQQDLLVKVEEHVHNVGHSQRSGEPVEPMISTQWFCDVDRLAERALSAVHEGDLRLVPATWEKTWEHWLTNIRPWVISRQLWWGHRIPAWYDRDGNCVVALNREEAEQLAGTSELEQDPDVLDTWFSSGLWPMSTLGWPDEQEVDFQRFYPTDVLVTGFDILFFWVARMVMMGLAFTDKTPFHTVHLTGLVRDAQGEKMSKTKGNTLDPLELVEEYGADAVRFTLCALDSPGRDIPLDPERMAGYRAFGNKIWNATRFALSYLDEGADRADSEVSGRVQVDLELRGLEAPERWILSRLAATAEYVDARFEQFRFDEACNRLYHFFWGELCDWYIELAKPALTGEAPRPRVGDVLATVLDRSLRLLHPVMPHLTEELWHRLPGVSELGWESLAVAEFPRRELAWRDPGVEEELATVIDLVGKVRSLRAERGVGNSATVRLFLESGPPTELEWAKAHSALIGFLTRAESVESGAAPSEALRDRVRGLELALDVERQPLGEEDIAKLQKEVAKIDGEIRGAESRLANPQFLERAPADVVEGSRQRLAELVERRRVVIEQLEALE